MPAASAEVLTGSAAKAMGPRDPDVKRAFCCSGPLSLRARSPQPRVSRAVGRAQRLSSPRGGHAAPSSGGHARGLSLPGDIVFATELSQRNRGCLRMHAGAHTREPRTRPAPRARQPGRGARASSHPRTSVTWLSVFRGHAPQCLGPPPSPCQPLPSTLSQYFTRCNVTFFQRKIETFFFLALFIIISINRY